MFNAMDIRRTTMHYTWQLGVYIGKRIGILMVLDLEYRLMLFRENRDALDETCFILLCLLDLRSAFISKKE